MRGFALQRVQGRGVCSLPYADAPTAVFWGGGPVCTHFSRPLPPFPPLSRAAHVPGSPPQWCYDVWGGWCRGWAVEECSPAPKGFLSFRWNRHRGARTQSLPHPSCTCCMPATVTMHVVLCVSGGGSGSWESWGCCGLWEVLFFPPRHIAFLSPEGGERERESSVCLGQWGCSALCGPLGVSLVQQLPVL